MVTDPADGWVVLVIVSGSTSTSDIGAANVNTVSSSVVLEPLAATGRSLTPVTVTVTVPVSEAAPSVTT